MDDRVAPSYGGLFPDIGPLLLRNGYSPVPINGHTKRPVAKGWTRELDERVWFEPRYCRSFTGIRGGFNGVVAIDIDHLDEATANRLHSSAREVFGDSPLLRIGRWPKRLLVYRSDGSIPKKRRFLDKSGGVVFEVLTQGQQFVAFGVHPTTGKPYHWPNKSPLEVPLSDLPLITSSQVDQLDRLVEGFVPRARRPASMSPSRRDGTAPASGTSAGRQIDGRNEGGTRVRYAVYAELLGLGGEVDIDVFARTSWQRFTSLYVTEATELSGNVYTFEQWYQTCLDDTPRLHEKLRSSHSTFSGTPPWYDVELVEAIDAQGQLEALVGSFLTKPSNMAIKITAGTGKTSIVARAIADAVGRHS